MANILQVRMVCYDLTNFDQSRQIFKCIADKICLGSKTWQNQLNKQNHDKLVYHLSYKLQQTCN